MGVYESIPRKLCYGRTDRAEFIGPFRLCRGSKKGNLFAEHKKDDAYISKVLKNWKKSPACFTQHQSSHCHKAALSYEFLVPACGDAVAMNNNQLVKRRVVECKYLKFIMECLQYLAHQGLALKGKEDDNDNFMQLLLLRAKDHPKALNRLRAEDLSSWQKKYTHNEFQDELLVLMANQVLRLKLSEVKSCKFFPLCAMNTLISAIRNNFLFGLVDRL